MGHDAEYDIFGAPIRGPFGNVASVSGRTLQRFSFASQQAAENLLMKARRALDSDDVERAAALVDRAAALPFDEHEGGAPAAIAVHMSLFSIITDALEVADEDDSRWLDAALAVLDSTDGPAIFDLRDVLEAIDQDYSISRAEHARIRAATTGIPDRPELRDLTLSRPELADRILAVLQAQRVYEAALAVR